MAYVQLELPASLPESVVELVHRGVEPLLQDVHWMMATMIAERGPREQWQRPIAHMLLATVAGVSTKLYCPPEGECRYTGRRFRNCLVRFYPWDIDTLDDISSEDAAEALYKVFRNPLVHNLGLGDDDSRVRKIGMVFRGTDDAEKRVEKLERLTTKPYTKPCLVANDEKYVLWLDPFYWGVRKMVERWANDAEQVAQADACYAVEIESMRATDGSYINC